MICQVKPIKNQPAKTSIDHAFALPKRTTPPEEPFAWSPIMAGPFIVPVTRWVE